MMVKLPTQAHEGYDPKHERMVVHVIRLTHRGSAMEIDVETIAHTYGLFTIPLISLAQPQLLALFFTTRTRFRHEFLLRQA